MSADDESDDSMQAFMRYLQGRRESYVLERKRFLGDDEYRPSRAQWDSIFEAEWTVIEERIRAGARVGHHGEPTEDALRAAYGEDVIDRMASDTLTDEITLVASEFNLVLLDAIGHELPYVHYEDFISLSNQGIFRLTEFLLDRQRRWEKKIVEELAVYGYERISTLAHGTETLIHIRERT
jgi:hypothetical protein